MIYVCWSNRNSENVMETKSWRIDLDLSTNNSFYSMSPLTHLTNMVVIYDSKVIQKGTFLVRLINYNHSVYVAWTNGSYAEHYAGQLLRTPELQILLIIYSKISVELGLFVTISSIHQESYSHIPCVLCPSKLNTSPGLFIYCYFCYFQNI